MERDPIETILAPRASRYSGAARITLKLLPNQKPCSGNLSYKPDVSRNVCPSPMALQPYNDFVVLHRRDALAQVGYRPVDLVCEKLEILSPMFRRQSWKRSFTVSKVGS